jgi:hypothetical protein
VSIRVGKTKLKRLEYARSVFVAATNKKNLTPATDIQRLEALRILVEDGELATFVPMLPLIFNLNGRPYDLDDHAPFEPLYNKNLPENLCLKTGRQTSKSTNQASRSLLLATSIPYFTTLFVFPLYEQVRRFSTQYVRKFIDESPLKKFWTGTSTENSVLQRSFTMFGDTLSTITATDPGKVTALMMAFKKGAPNEQAGNRTFGTYMGLVKSFRYEIEANMRKEGKLGKNEHLYDSKTGMWDPSRVAAWSACGPCRRPSAP